MERQEVRLVLGVPIFRGQPLTSSAGKGQHPTSQATLY